MNVVSGVRWQRWAVCVQETSDAPELWTPDRKPAGAVRVHLERMCRRCPVRRTCAANAVHTGAQAGMYAGVWVPQRRPEKAWVAAMQRLVLVAGGVEAGAITAEHALGVSA